MSHNERCKECKIRIKELLKQLYGNVEINHRFTIHTKPEEVRDHPRYQILHEIYTALQKYRNFNDFVKATYVDVDFYLPDQKIVVEFDESQHFTEPRRIALSHYPENIRLGFSRDKWMNLCETVQARDDDPPFRDEQRAWYDTLRDFIPETREFLPTVRLYAKDMIWCHLDPKKTQDVEKFRNLLHFPSEDQNYWLATVTLESNIYKYPDNDAEKNELKNLDRISALIRITTHLLIHTQVLALFCIPEGISIPEPVKLPRS